MNNSVLPTAESPVTLLPSIFFDQLADVYTEAQVSGRYTVLSKTRLDCRLLHMDTRLLATAPDRDEIAARRNMIFDGAYHMPEQCQVDVDGVRWAVVAGTFGALRDWNSNVVYRHCNVTRVQVGAFT